MRADTLNELCRRTGCELILDLYNLECDAHNYGLDIGDFRVTVSKALPQLIEVRRLG